MIRIETQRDADDDRDTRRAIAFDIETGPLPDAQLFRMVPEFVPPPAPGEFDQGAVKTGNLKDPAKIKEKIEAAREAHRVECDSYVANVEAARKKHFEDFRDGAALDAATGWVVAVGMIDEGGDIEIIGQDEEFNEENVLEIFWGHVSRAIRDSIPMVGHNIHGFDLPFLVQRSWLLGVPIPAGVMTGGSGSRKFWNPLFIDTMKEWCLFAPGGRIKLDTLARAFGFDGKHEGECCGKNFHEFWFSTDSAKNAEAREYLVRDLKLPLLIAQRMGVV